MVRLAGEKLTIILGVTSACVALTVIAFATKTWIVFAIMPVFALSGIGVPALQSFATRQVTEDQQGQFQGVLMAVVSLASIAAPLIFSSLYLGTRATWPGAIWLSVVIIYVLSLPLVLSLRFTKTDAGSNAVKV